MKLFPANKPDIWLRSVKQEEAETSDPGCVLKLPFVPEVFVAVIQRFTDAVEATCRYNSDFRYTEIKFKNRSMRSRYCTNMHVFTTPNGGRVEAGLFHLPGTFEGSPCCTDERFPSAQGSSDSKTAEDSPAKQVVELESERRRQVMPSAPVKVGGTSVEKKRTSPVVPLKRPPSATQLNPKSKSVTLNIKPNTSVSAKPKSATTSRTPIKRKRGTSVTDTTTDGRAAPKRRALKATPKQTKTKTAASRKVRSSSESSDSSSCTESDEANSDSEESETSDGSN